MSTEIPCVGGFNTERNYEDSSEEELFIQRKTIPTRSHCDAGNWSRPRRA